MATHLALVLVDPCEERGRQLPAKRYARPIGMAIGMLKLRWGSKAMGYNVGTTKNGFTLSPSHFISS